MGVERTSDMTNEYSVYASLLSANPAEADNIAAWLAEREAEKDTMNDKDIVETKQDNERLAAACSPFDENIGAAQIRILSKQFTAEPDVIPYVAVLDKWEEGIWLIVPFSKYKTPATPGEMETGLSLRGLKVIQAWNGRTVQEDLLKKSYLFATLPEDVRQDALALFRNQFAGTPLPETFKAKRGSLIELEDDPRREYLEESVARLRPLAEAVIGMEMKSSEGEQTGTGVFNKMDDADFWKDAMDRSKEGMMQIRLAAATDDNKSVLWMIEGKDDSLEAFKEVCSECRFLKMFRSIGGGRESYEIKFAAEISDAWKRIPKINVVARNRSTGEMVGKGELDTKQGKGFIRTIQHVQSKIETSHQIVLVADCGFKGEL